MRVRQTLLNQRLCAIVSGQALLSINPMSSNNENAPKTPDAYTPKRKPLSTEILTHGFDRSGRGRRIDDRRFQARGIEAKQFQARRIEDRRVETMRAKTKLVEPRRNETKRVEPKRVDASGFRPGGLIAGRFMPSGLRPDEFDRRF